MHAAKQQSVGDYQSVSLIGLLARAQPSTTVSHVTRVYAETPEVRTNLWRGVTATCREAIKGNLLLICNSLTAFLQPVEGFEFPVTL